MTPAPLVLQNRHVATVVGGKKEKKTPLLLSLTFYFLLFSLPSQVNDALEVFGERDIDPSLWMDGSNDGSIRQAHIRIGSRTSA